MAKSIYEAHKKTDTLYIAFILVPKSMQKQAENPRICSKRPIKLTTLSPFLKNLALVLNSAKIKERLEAYDQFSGRYLPNYRNESDEIHQTVLRSDAFQKCAR